MSLYFLQREHFNLTTPIRLWLIWQRKLLQWWQRTSISTVAKSLLEVVAREKSVKNPAD
jgi:hypothetical protein